jgi:hypothetical protein
MRTSLPYSFLLSAFVSSWFFPTIARSSMRQAPGKPLPAQVERISENVYRLGRVTVDLKAKSVTCDGRVNMNRGLIEYLAVAKGGKVHESLLEVDVRPLHLQLGLIMVGLEPRGGLVEQGDARVPQGSPVAIGVSWEKGGKETQLPAEQLVWDMKKQRPMAPGAWIFSGSSVRGAGIAADRELSLVATYRDPAAIVNNRLPEGADDTVYEANPRVAPRAGTAVQVVFQPAPGNDRP